MFFWVKYAFQKLRRKRQIGFGIVSVAMLVALLGNATCYYYFDGAIRPELTFSDAVWYSIVSITTMGYGDFFAVTPGARIGVVIFIVCLGLASFSAFLGLIIDRMMQINFKEVNGLASIHSKDHILIINFPDAVRVEQIIEELRRDPEFVERDVVIVTDALQTLPFEQPNVFFVKGSPLQAQTFERAGLGRARMALVLADSSNPASDGLVAAIINLIEHLNPAVKTVAECLDFRHDVLFRSTNCDSIVYAHKILNNLLVQEISDGGVAAVLASLTANQHPENLYSCLVHEGCDRTYLSLAKALFDKGVRLMTVTRGNKHLVNLDGLSPEKGDLVVYIADQRRAWATLCLGL